MTSVTEPLDRVGSVPLYAQIADALRADIRSGHYPPGVALPSERKLMDRFGVTRATIRNALGQLRSEGLLTIERGAGAFVRRPSPVRRIVGPERFLRRDRAEGKAAYVAEMEREGLRPEVEVIEVARTNVPPEIGERMGLDAGAEVVRRHRRYLASGEPLELATSYLPWALAKGTAIARRDTGPGGVYARLEERGHPIESFEEEITARMPTPEERSLLQIPEGVPVFRIVRRAYDADRRVLELTDTIMPADRYVLTYPFQAR
jgi:GntR family transcriptional regulator